ncbi:MAG: NADH:ubiquinone reductase (Na(+)-transporting) subunit C [Prevotella sp.]
MDTNSNKYIIIYSSVMVVVVAFVLAFVYQSLKSRQDANVALDKKKQILAALNIRDLTDEEAAARYAEVVLADRIVDASGKVVVPGTPGGEDAAFAMNSIPSDKSRLPIYLCNVDGKRKYVVPVFGMGLWGSIWGYVAVNEDMNTVHGAYFDHASETAGLGAEIKDSRAWQEQFAGKRIYDDGRVKVVLAVKKRSEIKDMECECDAVTGATLTSDGVGKMLESGLLLYVPFFQQECNQTK